MSSMSQARSTGVATAPASSANLGPGFDTLALALEVRCRCEATAGDGWLIDELGTTYEPAPGDLVLRAMHLAVGERPVRLRIDNAIPRSRGLGSSAAVVVAAAAAALRAHGEEPSDRQLFDIVKELEGHPDNAAAAVYGGLVAAKGDVVRHLPLSPDLVIVLGIPEEHLSTDKARAALPEMVTHAAAARNVARVALLLDGLRTGDGAALRAAGGDELHEAPRHLLSPATGDMMQAAYDAGALHAAWSGAGPAALAITTSERASTVMAAMTRVLAGSGEATVLEIAHEGWR